MVFDASSWSLTHTCQVGNARLVRKKTTTMQTGIQLHTNTHTHTKTFTKTQQMADMKLFTSTKQQVSKIVKY